MAKIVIPTTEEHVQAGKLLRDKCPRTSHGKVILGQGDKRDLVALIEQSNKGRLENLVPVRHGRMLQSAFAYFRGTADIHAYDLAGTPTSGINVQCCGDCHLVNFGGFATPERTLVFDINDFDETLPGPFEWDIKRLAASFIVAARWRGFPANKERALAGEVVKSYRESMKAQAGTPILETWYDKVTVEHMLAIFGKDSKYEALLKEEVAQASKQTSEHVFHKLTTPINGLPRIVDQPPLLYHPREGDLREGVVKDFLKSYRESLEQQRRELLDRFQPVDVAVKVVGVGSVGTQCYIVLLLAAPNDPLFLQVKEARTSVLARYAKQRVKNNGERVVDGQRLMQSASDIFLGWAKGREGRDFYVRQLRDMKMPPLIESQSPKVMHDYATLCGLVLARAHAKAGDPSIISGYLGSNDVFDQAIADYAIAYADQVERDYASFVKAVRSGRLKSDLSPSELETAMT